MHKKSIVSKAGRRTYIPEYIKQSMVSLDAQVVLLRPPAGPVAAAGTRQNPS